MRAVVQRVDKADVTVDGQVTGSVKKGLLVLLGVLMVTPKRIYNIWWIRLPVCVFLKMMQIR